MADPANSTSVPSRRDFFGSAVAAGIAAAGPPIFATPPGSSGLAAACAWVCARQAATDVPGSSMGWTDEEWEEEIARCDVVYQRAVREPSASPADIAAKARMLLADLARFNRIQTGDVLNELTAVVLREVIAAAGPA